MLILHCRISHIRLINEKFLNLIKLVITKVMKFIIACSFIEEYNCSYWTVWFAHIQILICK